MNAKVNANDKQAFADASVTSVEASPASIAQQYSG
jgi:hypothetical protein